MDKPSGIPPVDQAGPVAMTAGMETPQFRRAARSWGALLAVCLLLTLLAAVDCRLKHSQASINGFHPSDASCVLFSSDFPSFCAKLAGTDAAARFLSETPRPFEAFELSVRKATGIRPTPLRWAAWLGPRFVWARWDGTHGLCVHPGLLLRVVHFWRTLWGARPDEAGLHACSGYYYAWRDGFLLLSSSSRYVRAALDAAPAGHVPTANDNGLRLVWEGGDLRVRPEADLPVEGSLNIAFQAVDVPALQKDPWPGTALLTLSTPTPGDALQIWDTALRPFKTSPVYARIAPLADSLWTQWSFGELAEDWADPIGEFSVALTDVDTTETFPVPVWGVRMRARSQEALQTEHPWLPVLAPLAPIDYAWAGRQGHIATVLGERAAASLASDGPFWLATSQSALMNELLALDARGQQSGAGVMFTLNWKTAGQIAETLIRKAGELELIPEMNDQEANAYLGKYARAFGRLGRLRIAGAPRGESLAFEGSLVSPEEEGDSWP
ncbi:MAG: hypothetical protein ACOX5J_14390 [Candidatus Hydrogenedentales bacterium]|jgi:hypothetical protein